MLKENSARSASSVQRRSRTQAKVSSRLITNPSSKTISKNFFMTIVALSFFIFPIGWLGDITSMFGGSITGMAVAGSEQFTDSQDIIFSGAHRIAWHPEHEGILESLRISGTFTGAEGAELYLVKDGQRTLIADYETIKDEGTVEDILLKGAEPDSQVQEAAQSGTAKNGEGGKSVTASIAYNPGTQWDSDDDGIESGKGLIDFAIKDATFSDPSSDWEADLSKVCARWKVYNQDSEQSGSETEICNGNDECCALVNLIPSSSQWDSALELYQGRYGAGANNTVSVQVIYADYNLTSEIPYSDVANSLWSFLPALFTDADVSAAAKSREGFRFKEICADTCKLGKQNITLDGGAVFFDFAAGEGSAETVNQLIIEDITYEVQAERPNSDNKSVLAQPFNNSSINGTKKVRINLEDSKRKSIQSDVKILRERTDSVTGEKFFEKAAESIEGKELNIAPGRYSIELEPKDHVIKKIVMDNVDLSATSGGLLRIEDTPESEGFAEIYSIDPTGVNFSDAIVTVTAKGTELYKCKEWNFTEQACYGSWVKLMDIIPGQNYTFNLTPEDPGFAEINVTDAQHLDSDKQFLSNIYNQVSVLDNVWSEPIYHNQFVRARFDQNMTNLNVINLYVKNDQGFDTWVEVYDKNGTELLGSTQVISSTAMHDIGLSNMDGYSDTFDLKIVNEDDDPSAFLEFDYIHDATTNRVQNPGFESAISASDWVYSELDPPSIISSLRSTTNETEGTFSYQINLTGTPGAAGRYGRINQTINLTGINNITFDVVTTSAFAACQYIIARVYVDNLTNPSKNFTRQICTSTTAILYNQSLNVSAFSGNHTLIMELYVNGTANLGRRQVNFDNVRALYNNDSAPSWSSNSSLIVSTYSPNTLSYFNISWTDDIRVSSAFFESNYTGAAANYSMNNITATIYNYSRILPAGSFYWASSANDTLNKRTRSITFNFTVAKATPTINLTLNRTAGNFTIEVGTSANLTASIVTPGTGFLNLSNNGTIMNSGAAPISNLTNYTIIGLYNITAIYVPSNNYTSNYSTWWLTVRDTQPPGVIDIIPTSNYNYNASEFFMLSANVTDNIQSQAAYANVTYPNGTLVRLLLANSIGKRFNNSFTTPNLKGRYNVTFMANDTSGNENTTQSTFFNVVHRFLNTSLNYPFNGMTVNESIIQFNFTVNNDYYASTANCTLIANFSGRFENNATAYNIANNTNVNITVAVADGIYRWNVNCTDKANLAGMATANFTLNVSTQTRGIFAYEELNVQTPKYRIWNDYNFTGNMRNDTNAIGIAGADLTWLVTRGSHESKEFILGTEDKTNDVNVQIYNITSRSWGNLLEVSVDVPNAGFRAFDIAYEDVAGRALIVYENSSAGDQMLVYRVWNGTSFTAQQALTTTLPANSVNWISLSPKKGSNDIMLLAHDNTQSLYAVLWNGSGFDTSKQSNLSSATASASTQHFSYAWEESSGEGMAAYAEGTNWVYRLYHTTGWNASTVTENMAEAVNALRLCSDQTSDYIGIIMHDAGDDVNARMWNGNAVLASPPAQDGTVEPTGTDSSNVACMWNTGGNLALFGFADLALASVDWFNFTKASNAWSATDLTTVDTTVNFATSNIRGLRFTQHPRTNEIMFVAQDTSNDVSAIRWTGAGFEPIVNSKMEVSTEVVSGAQESAMFDWYRFDQAPRISNLTVINGTLYNVSQAVNITMNVTDDYGISAVVANMTLPNGTTQQVSLIDDDSDTIYNGSYTFTIAGTFNLTIVANDSSTHKNINASSSILLVVNDFVAPAVTDLRPVANTDYNVSDLIEIAANATDNVAVHTVMANLTYPNTTRAQLALSRISGTDKYNNSFTIPPLTGRYNLTILANDTSGRLNNTETSFFVSADTSAPTPSNPAEYPADPATYSPNLFYQFNVTWTDNVHIDNVTVESNLSGALQNRSVTWTDGNVYYYNITDLRAAVYVWKMIANDSSGNYNSTIQYNYTVQKAATSTQLFLNGSRANLSTVYRGGFNATGNTSVINVSIYRNGTLVNDSTATKAFYYANLAAGSYNITAKNPGNENYTNSSETWWLNITPAASSVSLFINGSAANTSLNVSEKVNITGIIVSGEDGSLTLYQNGTQINQGSAVEELRQYAAPGMYNLTLVYNASQNYSSSFATWWLNVSDRLPPTPSNSTEYPADPATYSPAQFFQFNVSWNDNYAMKNVLIEHNFTGTLINYSATGNETSMYFYNRTGLKAAVYVWRMIANDTHGNRNMTDQYTYTVGRNYSLVNLSVNGTEGNYSINVTQSVNLTGILTVGEAGSLTLYENGAQIGQGDSPLEVLRQYSSPGMFNLTLVYNATENYTMNHSTRWINVSPDSIAPTPSDPAEYPADPATYSPGKFFQFNVTWTDNYGVANVSIEANFSGTLQNYSVLWNNGNVYYYNVTDLKAAVYVWRMSANDTSSNRNVTEQYTYTVQKAATNVQLFLNGSRANLSTVYRGGFNATGNTSSVNVSIYKNGALVNDSGKTTAFYYDNLAVGLHNLTAKNPGNANYTGSSEEWWLDITRAVSSVSLLINGTAANYTINASSGVNLTGLIVSGEDGSLTIYQNGTQIGQGATSLSVFRQYPVMGMYNITLAYNTSQNYSSSFQTFWINVIDQIAPTPSNPTEYPSDPATYAPNQFYQFNTSWTDNVGVQNVLIEHNFTGTLQNSSVAGNLSTMYFYNLTDLKAAVYVWRMIANDSSGNHNASPQQTYTVSKGATSTQLFLNGSQANLSTAYHGGFNASGSTNLINVSLYRNGTLVNASGNLIAFYYSDLAAGQYNITAVNPGNANYTGSSETWWLTITKAASEVNLLINGTDGNYSTAPLKSINYTGFLTAGEFGSLTLYENGTQINQSTASLEYIRNYPVEGTFNITLVFNETQNYSSSFEEHWLFVTITDITAPLSSGATEYPTDPAIYASGQFYQFNVSWTDDTAVKSVLMEHNFTGTPLNYSVTGNVSDSKFFYNRSDIKAGVYYWRMIANDTFGNTGATARFSYTIEKAATSTQLFLNGSRANLSTVYLGGFNATGNTSYINVSIYKNGTLVNDSGKTTSFFYDNLPAGMYNITAKNPGNENYTNSSETWWLNMTPAASSVSLFINGTEGNYTINVSDYVNITGLLNTGQNALTLYQNGTLINAGASPLVNLSRYTVPGMYNLTLVYNSSQNFSSSSVTWWLNVSDTLAPTPSNPTEYPSDPATYVSGQLYQFNVTWVDNYALANVSIEANFSGTLQNYSVLWNNGNFYYYNVTDLKAGVYVWKMIANDTSGNHNSTEQYTYTVQKAATSTQLFLNGSRANLSTVYKGGFNATGNTSLINVSIYRNGILVNGSSATTAFYYANLAAGSYNITAKNPGNENYTNSSETWWLNMTPAASSVILLINGTQGNYSMNTTAWANLTGLLTAGEGSLTLYENGTQIGQGNSPFEAIRQYNNSGMYNLTLRHNSTENYSLSSMTHWLNVSPADKTAPAVIVLSPLNNSVDVDGTINFSCSVTDNQGLANISLNFNGTLNQTVVLTGISSIVQFNVSNLDNSSYLWNCSAYDLYGNLNQSPSFTLNVNRGVLIAFNTSYFAGNTTNWSAVPDITNVCNGTAQLDNPAWAAIQWFNCVNASTQNFSLNVKLDDNNITVIFGLNPTFNTTARLTFRNLPWEDEPVVYKDGVYCPEPLCSNVTYSGGVAVLNVTSFSSYITGSNARLGIYDQTDAGMLYAGMAKYIGNLTQFFANYTRVSNGNPITGAACTINFTDQAAAAMTYNSTKTMYEYSRSFSTFGNFTYNVTCDRPGTERLNLSDNATILENIAPTPSNIQEYPSDPATYSPTQFYQFNVTWVDNYALANVSIEANFSGTLQNYSVLWNNGNVYYYNVTDLKAAVYVWRMKANDTTGNLNTTPQQTYTVNKASPSTQLFLNGSRANLSTVYLGGFNATGNTSVVNVSIYRNGTLVNDSGSVISFYYANLAAGQYNITARNPGSANYSVSSEEWWLNITPAASSVNLLINGTDGNYSLNIAESANFTGFLVIGENGSLTLYEDGVQIAQGYSPLQKSVQYTLGGLHNITLAYNSTMNYSKSFETHWVNVIDQVAPTPSNPTEYPSDPATYAPGQSFQFNTTWTDNSDIKSVTIEHNFTGTISNYSATGNASSVYYYNTVGIKAGLFSWRMIANDSAGNYNASASQSYTVNKASTTTNLFLNGSQANLSTVYLGGFNATGKTAVLNVTLYNNGTAVNASTATIAFYHANLAAGSYNITANNHGNENYTNSSETWWLNITPAASAVSLYANGASGNATINTTQVINITGLLTAGEDGSLTLYQNGTQINQSAGTMQTFIVYTLPGMYNLTLVYNTSQNYSSSFTTSWLNITDRIKPAVIGATTSPAMPFYNIGNQQDILVNFTSSEYPITLIFTLFNSTTVSVDSTGPYSLASAADLPKNYTIPGSLIDGTYTLNITVTDSSGNVNLTTLGNFIVDSVTPVINDTVISTNMPLYKNSSAFDITVDFNSTEYPINITFRLINSTGSVTNVSGPFLVSSKASLPKNYSFLSTLKDDTYTLYMNATDAAGNVNVTNVVTIYVDNVPPTVSGVSVNPTLPGVNFKAPSSMEVTFTSNEYPINVSFALFNSAGSIVNTTNLTYLPSAGFFPVNYTMPGLLDEGNYTLNMTVSDMAYNKNLTILGTLIVDNSTPQFNALTTVPSSADDLDPNSSITVNANVTDNLTAVKAVILQYKLGNASEFTNLTMVFNASTAQYGANFTPTENGTYVLQLFANDTVSNAGFSNTVNISVQFDRTWARTPAAFDTKATTADKNVSLGNLVINNTGDYSLNFTVTSDYATTIFNDSSTFVLAAKQTKTLKVNDTALATGLKTVTLNITATPDGDPASRTTTGGILVAPGQPILRATFTNPTAETIEANQSQVNLAFDATLENIGEGTAHNITFFFILPSDWLITFGSKNVTFNQILSGNSETNSIEVTIPAGALTGNRTVFANSTAVNDSGISLAAFSALLGDKIDFTVKQTATSLGTAAVSSRPSGAAQAATGTAAAGSTPNSAASGGSVGRASIPGKEAIYTSSVISIMRGQQQNVPLTITNLYENAYMKDVEISVIGYLSQYIKISPPSVFARKVFLDSKNIFINSLRDPLAFKIGEEGHKMTLNHVEGGIAYLTLESRRVNLSLKPGEIVPVDFNDDNESDVAVSLKSVLPTAVNVTVYRYGSPDPGKISFLEERNWTLDFFVPSYLYKDEFNITLRITGMIIPINPKLAGFDSQDFIEYRTLVFRIYIVGKDEAESRLSAARKDVQAMIDAWLPSSLARQLLEQAEKQFADGEYEDVVQTVERIAKLKDAAFKADAMIKELQKAMGRAKAKWLPIPFTESAYALAINAFEREDFETALLRAKDAQLTLVLETRGKINVLLFISMYWWAVLLGIIASGFLGFAVYSRIVAFTISWRIRALHKEDASIVSLITEAQEDYAKGVISGGEYHRVTAQYRTRIAKIRQSLVHLRHKRVNILQWERELKDLAREEREVSKLIKSLQTEYLVKGAISRIKFFEMMKLHNQRMGEIDKEKKAIESKLRNERGTFNHAARIALRTIYSPAEKLVELSVSLTLKAASWVGTVIISMRKKPPRGPAQSKESLSEEAAEAVVQKQGPKAASFAAERGNEAASAYLFSQVVEWFRSAVAAVKILVYGSIASVSAATSDPISRISVISKTAFLKISSFVNSSLRGLSQSLVNKLKAYKEPEIKSAEPAIHSEILAHKEIESGLEASREVMKPQSYSLIQNLLKNGVIKVLDALSSAEESIRHDWDAICGIFMASSIFQETIKAFRSVIDVVSAVVHKSVSVARAVVNRAVSRISKAFRIAFFMLSSTASNAFDSATSMVISSIHKISGYLSRSDDFLYGLLRRLAYGFNKCRFRLNKYGVSEVRIITRKAVRAKASGFREIEGGEEALKKLINHISFLLLESLKKGIIKALDALSSIEEAFRHDWKPICGALILSSLIVSELMIAFNLISLPVLKTGIFILVVFAIIFIILISMDIKDGSVSRPFSMNSLMKDIFRKDNLFSRISAGRDRSRQFMHKPQVPAASHRFSIQPHPRKTIRHQEREKTLWQLKKVLPVRSNRVQFNVPIHHSHVYRHDYTINDQHKPTMKLDASHSAVSPSRLISPLRPRQTYSHGRDVTLVQLSKIYGIKPTNILVTRDDVKKDAAHDNHAAHRIHGFYGMRVSHKKNDKIG